MTCKLKYGMEIEQRLPLGAFRSIARMHEQRYNGKSMQYGEWILLKHGRMLAQGIAKKYEVSLMSGGWLDY